MTPGHVSRPGKFIANPCSLSINEIVDMADKIRKCATAGQSPDATIAADRLIASPLVGGIGVGGIGSGGAGAAAAKGISASVIVTCEVPSKGTGDVVPFCAVAWTMIGAASGGPL